MMYTQPDWISVAVLAVFGVAMLFQRVQEYRSPDGVDAIKEQYANGEITLDEFERRVALEIDGDAQQIRESIESVQGIGPELSAAVAVEYRSLDELREADADELAAINGIGESRGEAIVEYVQR